VTVSRLVQLAIRRVLGLSHARVRLLIDLTRFLPSLVGRDPPRFLNPLCGVVPRAVAHKPSKNERAITRLWVMAL
jgi:hypothetical protein